MIHQENFKHDKVAEVLRELASKFISEESNRSSMITITRTDLQPDFKKVTFFVTVYPPNQENAGLDFLRRQRSDCKFYIRERARLGRIPLVDFQLDTGEKSRQRIEEISQNLDL